jgi:hypothetical protein
VRPRHHVGACSGRRQKKLTCLSQRRGLRGATTRIGSAQSHMRGGRSWRSLAPT